MRRLGPLLVLVLAATLTLSTSAPGAVAGSAQAGASVAARKGGAPEATFNAPRPFGGKKAQNRILNRVDAAINGVPRKSKANPDPTIAITSYLLDRTTSVTAIINACKRGVGVRVIIDNDVINKNSRRLISALNGDNVRMRNGKIVSQPKTGKCGRPKKHANKMLRPNARIDAKTGTQLLTRQQAKASLDEPLGASKTWGRDRSYVVQCSGSCRNKGTGGNMHLKMYVFSKTHGDKNVVMVSSSNLNRGGAKAGWNDLYVMKNRPRSYRYYLMAHRAMTQQKRADKERLQIVDGPFTTRFFPMRKASKRNDPTLKDLQKIRCHSALGRTEIHISMFYWKGKRGNYLVDRLLTLAGQGCKVNIIYGAPSRQIAARLRAAAGAHRINLFDSRWDFNDDGYNEVRTHAKYVAVKGTYAGNHRAYVVMTGSQNWVGGSLTLSDESTLNIAKKSAYRLYRHEWEVIKKHSRKLPYH